MTQTSEAIRPEYFRLPAAGQHDPFFGFSRTRFYELEACGAIRLTRLIPTGKTRGITLVPFVQLRDYLRGLGRNPQPKNARAEAQYLRTERSNKNERKY